MPVSYCLRVCTIKGKACAHQDSLNSVDLLADLSGCVRICPDLSPLLSLPFISHLDEIIPRNCRGGE